MGVRALRVFSGVAAEAIEGGEVLVKFLLRRRGGEGFGFPKGGYGGDEGFFLEGREEVVGTIVSGWIGREARGFGAYDKLIKRDGKW